MHDQHLAGQGLEAVDQRLLSCAIGACQEGAQWQEALHLLGMMPKGPGNPQHRVPALGAACSACERCLRWRKALLLAEGLLEEGLRSNVVLLGSVLSAWSRGFQWDHALKLLAERGVQNNIITYTAASSAMEKAQHWRWALELFLNAGAHGLRFNVQSFSCLQSACAEHGQWTMAVAIMKIMSDYSVTGNDACKNALELLPSDYSFNALARASQRGRAWQGVCWVFGSMEEQTGLAPDVMTLAAVSEACEQGAQAAAVPELCSDLKGTFCADGNQDVLVLELLSAFDSLDSTTSHSFWRRRALPAALRLGGSSTSFGHDPLMGQFTLGESFTRWVCDSKYEAFLASARLNARRGSTSIHVIDEPLATALATWLAASFATPSRLVGHGGSGLDGTPLQPVLVRDGQNVRGLRSLAKLLTVARTLQDTVHYHAHKCMKWFDAFYSKAMETGAKEKAAGNVQQRQPLWADDCPRRGTRMEKDLLGSKEVPKNAYYGIQTLRALECYNITGIRLRNFPEFIVAFAMVKKACANANYKLGLLDVKKKEAIVRACNELIDPRKDAACPIFQTRISGAGTSTNMNANEVIANRALELLGHEKGQYEQRKSFFQKAEEFADVVKMGRTQLQDAVPMTTLGQEFHAYGNSVASDIDALTSAVNRFTTSNLGGTAIGTGIAADPHFSQVAVQELRSVTGFPMILADDLIEASSSVGDMIYFSGMLRRIAAKVSKICNDLRLLSSGPRCGLSEINLPPKAPGSSIMPGKAGRFSMGVNPVIPEVMNMCAFEAIGNDVTVAFGAEAGQLELNVMEPVIIYKLFSSIRVLSRGINTLREHCIEGITANREHCKEMVHNSIGVVTALLPHIGYKKCTEAADRATRDKRPVADIIVELGFLKREERASRLELEDGIGADVKFKLGTSFCVHPCRQEVDNLLQPESMCGPTAKKGGPCQCAFCDLVKKVSEIFHNQVNREGRQCIYVPRRELQEKAEAPDACQLKRCGFEEMPQEQLAQYLREKHADVFSRLDKLSWEAKQVDEHDEKPKHVMSKGQRPVESTECAFCGARKHTHKWLYRAGKKGLRRCNGSTCAACYRSAILLRVSRSKALIENSGAISIFKVLSSRVRRNFGDEDVCECAECKPKT
ncbi:unnamed protein product [Durusdinium trenchii]|uniref:Aspartate ammonia-lyase n=1 Tax=Durusdinium trenchii TaxID=1381693 RepID=A0ABP0LEY8_9DINO